MIVMRDKQEIILSYFRDGESKSEIARRLGMSRVTVKKYIAEYSAAKDAAFSGAAADCGELSACFTHAPVYDSSTRGKRKLTSELIDRVKDCLEANRGKRSRGQQKQQMKKIDIYELLEQEGYDITYIPERTWENKYSQRVSKIFSETTATIYAYFPFQK